MPRKIESVIIGLVLCPLAVIAVCALQAALNWIDNFIEPHRFDTPPFPDPSKPLEYILLFSLYGVPTAAASLILIGLPLTWCASRLNLGAPLVVLLLAFLLPLPAAAVWGPGFFFSVSGVYHLVLPHALVVGTAFLIVSEYEPNRRPTSPGKS